jgi:glucose-6-phosphate-specific signal transduction histidine kinase
VPKLLPRRSVPDANRVGILARMRVGTKLMLLVLLPVCGLLVFASIAVVDDWREADRLREFRSATRLSFEALTNVVKHARAARADVSVHVEDDTLHIAVRDDGVGGARPDGSGLVGLRDRLEALDGRLRIDSPTGRGTLVAAKIPLSGHPIAQATPTPESATSANT